MSNNKFSANEIFLAVQSEKKRAENPNLALTKYQREAVEEASTNFPSLVVAGAGSGKTELMAIRVLWLVANGHALPQEILGLTFTRKAASELSKRINNGLLKLSRTEYWPEELKGKAIGSPNISTYNAYANALFHDHALALGYEPDSLLLTDASRYKLAREVVIKYGADVDSRLDETELSLNSLIESVLSLAGEMNDNGVRAEEINDYIDFVYNRIASLPTKGQTEEAPITKTRFGEWEGAFNTRIVANLAERFIEEKKRLGFVDYSDQVALAVRAIHLMPELVRDREKSLYKHVMLDEYQDTSTLQTRLLQGLFAKHSVIAVGDPNQSIYGWRGASASNLREFLTTFGTPDREVRQFQLPTSWRNPKSVLRLANRVLVELNNEPNFIVRYMSEAQLTDYAKAKVKVDDLQARDDAPEGDIELDFCVSQSAEAERVAIWFARKMSADRIADRPTAALLLRSKTHMSAYVDALHRHGLNVEVVGVAGLLEMPEIVDLVAALRVIHYPTAGTQLIRLLTGPRWRIGAKDIQRLYHFARKAASFNNTTGEQVFGEEVETSLIDALDQLLDLRSYDTGITADGLARMKDCARLLRTLRRQVGLPLPEFVRVVEQELWLDIELAANPKRSAPMAQLNAFANVVSNYASSHSATLGGFLEWLEYAATRETFESPSISAAPGVVQVISIHSAKGLEWDAVAVPMLNKGTFPSSVGGYKGWVSMGKLPYDLRGDRESLPRLVLDHATKQTEIDDALEIFSKEDVKEYRDREDRRLAYVAVTRTKQSLLVTGSRWKPGVKGASNPSVFLEEMAEHLGLGELPLYPEVTENPDDKSEVVETWPLEPLGAKHRPRVEAAAEATREAMRVPSASAMDAEIDMMINDEDEKLRRANQARLPVRIPASRFKDFLLDTAKVAEDYRRPMPREPFAATMAGTLFHAWVESRFGVFSISDEIDAMEPEADGANEALNIEHLKDIFEKSRFAQMTPADVECEIQVTIRENTFICKIDAVFETEDGYEIVDWKTGVAPKTEDDIAEKALQLALYRMAYSKFHGIDPSKIDVCLYYVNENIEIKPEQVKSRDELLEMWDAVLSKVTD